jgi:RNA polymerase sigma-70 factor (ECF subfamily)
MVHDARLVEGARAGDAAAWASLHRAHAGRLTVWLSHLAPRDSVASAEDLAAESWLTAAERIHEFRGGDDAFAGWLFGIARNHARNAVRRTVRRQTTPTGVVEDTLVLPFGSPALEEQVAGDDWVQTALAQLPEREREVITCIDVVGLDNSAAAAALGISAIAVRVARHRGLGRLRRTVDTGPP